MIKRTLYFGNPCYLSLSNAQLIMRLPEVEKNENLPETFKKTINATVPIEDIGIVVLDHKQITITQALMEALLDNNVALVTCNSTHHPTGLMLPLCGNTIQTERFRAQLDATEPLKKQLWAQTVAQKIMNQAAVLESQNINNAYLLNLAKNVKSGDGENAEATGAAYYWKEMGKVFMAPHPDPLLQERGKPDPLPEEREEYRDHLFKGAKPSTFDNAHNLRLINKTKAEEILWQVLRNRQVENAKFRRQHPLNNFIADFYCHEKKLVIEVDGGYHNEQDQKKQDDARTAVINEFGIQVVRFTNDDIFHSIITVIQKIAAALATSPRPSPEGEGESEVNAIDVFAPSPQGEGRGEVDNLAEVTPSPTGEGWGEVAAVFTRTREGSSPNNYLNYGYAILRATMARSIVSAGLLPTLGIFHHNRYNAYCLADDLMEPYRPYVDKVVCSVIKEHGLMEDIPKEIKAILLQIPAMDVLMDGEKSPLMNATQRTATSLVKCFNGEQRKLLYPDFI
jgi:CRISPR/Cas system-associated endonuclease Cas1/very-short-patch-repair endonuclease